MGLQIRKARGTRPVVRKLGLFLRKLGDRIGLRFGWSRKDVQEELAAYWLALNLHVMRGDVNPAAPIPIGDSDGNGDCFAGFMTVHAVLRTVRDCWGRWDHKTQVRWCRILAEASRNLLREETGSGGTGDSGVSGAK